ncbi:MAG: hypothetical protein IJR57_09500 [Ruminococcus sp.]|nr:hypothetical protein [Ruminococcus sp.]
MKRIMILSLLVCCLLLLTGCGHQKDTADAPKPTQAPTQATSENAPSATEAQTSAEQSQEEQQMTLQMTLGDTPVAVAWEDNDATAALIELCREQPLTIRMSMYGGFEQVGSIGAYLPQDDVQTTTEAGDIVLYSGDQMVVFYGSNSWSYTRLGHITDKTPEELTRLLSNGDVTAVLSV